ncbi:MAG: hypothetical protein E7418_04120 [Ruminococcaceae bacterium]|nr:hypothetical protein [Oscillospiraceae bacterium]
MSTHISELYKQVYKRLDDVTPLTVDCGELCDKLCCRGDEESGMYLFPGEERLFIENKNYSVLPTDFIANSRPVQLVVCHGPCTRTDRPLACRIFPFFPHYKRDEGLRIALDPRARLCPLTSPEATPYISKKFLRRLEKVFSLLIKFPEIAAYLEAITCSFDDLHALRKDFV